MTETQTKKANRKLILSVETVRALNTGSAELEPSTNQTKQASCRSAQGGAELGASTHQTNQASCRFGQSDELLRAAQNQPREAL